MTIPIRVLILEVEPDHAKIMVYQLQSAGFEPEWRCLGTEADYIAALQQLAPLPEDIDLILADYRLLDFDALRALHLLRESGLDIPFIVVTGAGSEEIAVECMKQGAADYLLKDRLERLGQATRRALQEKKLRGENRQADERLRLLSSAVEQSNEGLVATDLAGFEQQSKERQLYLESVLACAPDAIVTMDAQHQVLDWNPGAEQLFGYSPEEAIGRDLDELIAARNAEMYQEAIGFTQQAMAGELVPPIETIRYRKDGTVVNVILAGSPIFVGDELVGTVAVYTDITERKRAEEALRESEERYRRLFEDSPICLWEEDFSAVKVYLDQLRDEGVRDFRTYLENHPKVVVQCAEMVRVLDINKAAMKLYGVEDKDLLRGNLVKAFSPESYDSFRKELIAIAEGKNRFESDTITETLAGEKRHTVLRWSVAPGHEETRSRVLVSIVDITERKQAEEALRHRAEELEALQATVLDLTIRHDLSTLLEIIVERAARLLNALSGGLYLCEPDQEQVRCLVSHNTPHDYTGTVLEYGEGAAGIVAQSGEPLIIDDYRTWNGRAAVYEEEQPFRAVLAVPMVWQGQVTGVIDIVHYAEDQVFTQADLELLTLFANHAAIAVENTRLYEEIRRELTERKRAEEALAQRATQLALLNDIGGRIAGILDLESVLDRAATLVHESFGYYHVALFTVDGEREELLMRTRDGAFDSVLPTDHRLKLGRGMVGWVGRHGETLLANDIAAEPRYINVHPDRLPTGSELTVPIRVGKEIVGVLDVQSPQLNAFDEDDVMVMETLADQIAVAIHNAQLYEAIQRELAERRRAEEALRRSESQYRTTLNSMGDAIHVADKDLRFVLFNDAMKRWCEELGLETDVLGKPIREVFPFLPDGVYREYNQVFETGQLFVSEETTRVGSKEFVTDTRKIPVIEDGQVTLVVTVIRDITERKQAEANIRELKEFNESIVQNMTEGIAIQDAEGYFTFINPAAATLLGYAPEELLGQYWTIIVPPDQHPIIQAVDERRKRGDADRYEVELVRKDGTRFPALVSGRPRFDQDSDRFTGTLAVFTDISERVQAEEKLARRAREMAALYATSLEINSQPDLSTLLHAIVQRATGLVGARLGALYLMQPDTEELELVVSHNLPRDYTGTILHMGEGLSGRVAQKGDPMMVADYQHWEGRADVYADGPFRRILGVPLKVGDQVIGVINVIDDEQVGPFEEDEIRLVSLFADQAAIAIQNARLFEAEARQRREAETLRAATQALTTTLDLPQVFELILSELRKVVPYDSASVQQLKENRLEIIGGHGFPKLEKLLGVGFDLTARDNPNRWVVQSRAPLILDDAPAVYEEFKREPHAQVGIRSWLGVPLLFRDRLIGMIALDKEEPGFYTEEHARLAMAFAAQAAIAIENAQLFRSVERGKRDWEATFDTSQDAVALVDRDQHIVRANKAFANLVQREFSQIIGQAYGTMLPGTTCLETACSLQGMIGSDRPTTCTHEYCGRIFEVQATPILEGNGAESEQIARTIYVMRDITERQRAEDEIRRRNRELALLNRVIAASAVSQEIEPILETICRELALALGVPRAAAALLNEGKTEMSVVAEYRPEDQHSVLGMIIELPDDLRGHLLALRAPLVFKDARSDPRLTPLHSFTLQYGIVSMLLLPLLTDGEVVGGLTLIGTELHTFSAEEVDLAQRVAHQVSGALARARLAETQRQLSAAVEQAAEAVMVTDTNGTMLYVNPAFEQIVGYDRAEVLGQSPHILKRSGFDTPLHQQLWHAVTAGQVWQQRVEHARRDDRLCTLDLTVAPVRNQAGEIVNYVATMRDVTREMQLEEQFRQSQKMEALGRLAGGIAHDFNNLLTVIHLSTRLLERQMHPEDPLWEHVQRIHETGERAAKLTKQLLSFSRREVIEPQVLNLSQIVRDLSRMLQRIIGEDITMAMVLADDLWPLRVDPSQIDQVLMNLVVNARDAMPEGGTLTIETANITLDKSYAARHVDVQPGEYVMLAISDTGIGIDDEARGHLFEPFFTTKERGEGTGLGLSTVFGIVRQGGGHIDVYSQVGQGTTFRIYFPRAKEVKAATPSPARSPLADDLIRGTETVLVVEDETAVRDLAVSVLKACGYQVLAAKSGPEALQISKEHGGHIHMLITDLVMPQMSGKELAEVLLAQQPELRILYVSGYADKEIAQHGVLAPGTVFLPKPFTIEELTRKVRAVLDHRV